MKIFDTLNPHQQTAVTIDGPVLIVAGPGTGKTRTLVAKIAYLVQEKKVAPENILALTFTKKAAAEIKERIETMFSDGRKHIVGAGNLTVSTFHALGSSILSSIEQNDFQLATDQLQKNALKTALQELKKQGIALKTKDAALMISKHKNHSSNDKTAKIVTERYDQILHEKKWWDFDDLLLQAFQMLKENSELRTALQKKFQHILIDEFQDTSPIQYELISQLVGPDKNIFVIGDPLQAIYGFRGASSAAFDQFRKDFPDKADITLQTNYRSSQSVIDLAHALFPESQKLQSENSLPATIEHLQTFNEYSEADWIINKIHQLLGGTELLHASQFEDYDTSSLRFSDVAVLYRTHHIARVLKQKIKDSALPFQIVGGGSLFEQPSVEWFTSLLRFIQSPATQPLMDILSTCPLRLDEKKLLLLEDLQSASAFSSEALSESLFSGLPEPLPKIIQGPAAYENPSLTDLAQSLEPFFKDPKTLQQLQTILVGFKTENDPIAAFLQYYEHLKSHDFYNPLADKITLLSMHASKGLEFNQVFLIGFEDGIIPHGEKTGEEFEEEKRLLYVGLTRAKQGLYLTSTQKRAGEKSNRSPFLNLLPADILIDSQDAAIQKIEKKLQKRKQQQEQQRLF